MATQESNVLILYRGKHYKFINCSLNKSDGSFYLTFCRDGVNSETITYDYSCENEFTRVEHDEPRKKLVRVSYHSSGLVNYHHTEIGSNIFEPITRLSGLNFFAIWSIPSIEKLDIVETVKGDDYVICIDSGDDERINFEFMLAPWQHKENKNHFAIRYENILSLIIIPTNEDMQFPEELESHFTTIAPKKGLFDAHQISREQALIEFHQKLNQTNEIILYSPNREGICTMITSVVMARSPDVMIQFIDSTLSLEVISKKQNVIKFKIKDKHGNTIKEDVPILEITLSAEL